MGKDKKAREHGRLTIYALANLVAAVVDAMSEMDVPPMVIHRFMDRMDRLNEETLHGQPLHMMTSIIHAIRRSVPCND